jgi:hypothetical protein
MRHADDQDGEVAVGWHGVSSAQLAGHQRQELVGSAGIALLHGGQNARDLVHEARDSPAERADEDAGGVCRGVVPEAPPYEQG